MLGSQQSTESKCARATEVEVSTRKRSRRSYAKRVGKANVAPTRSGMTEPLASSTPVSRVAMTPGECRQHVNRLRAESRARMSAQKRRRVREQNLESKKAKRASLKVQLAVPETSLGRPLDTTNELLPSMPPSPSSWPAIPTATSPSTPPPTMSLQPGPSTSTEPRRLPKSLYNLTSKSSKAKKNLLPVRAKIYKKKIVRPRTGQEILNTKVQIFYIRSDISRQLPHQRYATKAGVAYVMNLTIRGAYLQFLQENPGCSIGYTKFALLRPRFVKKLGSVPAETCLCIYCLNVRYKLTTLKRALSRNSLGWPLPEESKVLDWICCPRPEGARWHKPACFLGQCEECRDSLRNFRRICTPIINESVSWSHWGRGKSSTTYKLDVFARTGLVTNSSVLDQAFIAEVEAPVSQRLNSLESDFQDGNVTLKGYWKKKSSILDSVLPKDAKEKVCELNAELENEEITSKGYYKKMELTLAPFLELYKIEESAVKDETKEVNETELNKGASSNGVSNGAVSSNGAASSNGAVSSNGSPNADFKSHIAGKLSEFQWGSQKDDVPTVDHTTSSTSTSNSKVSEDESHSNGHASENISKSSNVSPKDTKKNPEKKEQEANGDEDDDCVEVDGDESDTSPPPKKKSKETPPSKTATRRSGRIKADSNQPSIMSMFSPRAKSESSSQVEDSEKGGADSENDNKRQRLEGWDKTKQDLVNAVTITNNSSKMDREKCKECLKFLDDPELKLFPGDPAEALEECLALIDSRLNLFTGEEDPEKLMDETPLHKITNFSVYDKHRHMCPFDMGLIESNKLLYFSGVLKPIFEENPSPDDGVPCCDMGPINEWHIAGFDGGERSLIGFSTGYGTYYLMEPSDAYAPVMEHVKVKVHLAKIVIEFVMNNEEATYEDLLNKIETTVPPSGVNNISEDSLLRHAQFVVDRIQSFDDAANDEETILLTTPCIRSLINLAGVILGKRNKHGRAERRVKKKDEKPKHTMATVTPLVRSIFDSLFKDQIIEEIPKGKKQRCGTCETCLLPDCGQCTACKDMIKFGGSGRSKQACKERRCPNMAFKDAEDNDAADEEVVLEKERKKVKEPSADSKKHKLKRLKAKVSWLGKPERTSGKRTYYSKVKVNEFVLNRADFVTVAADDVSKPSYVARIETLYEDNGKSLAHVQWFLRGLETVLGVVSDPLEVFMVDDCEDIELIAVTDKVKVVHKKAPDNWSLLGGTDDPDSDSVVEDDDGKTFFYQLFYNTIFGRFEDIPENLFPVDDSEVNFCVCCVANEVKELKTGIILGEEVKVEDGSSNYKYYGSVRKNDVDYHIGDCCYIDPEGFGFKIKHAKAMKPVKSKDSKNIDEDVYPEAYRKSVYVKGSNEECPEPFRIGRISNISSKKSAGKNPSESEIKITINKFYRVENTHKGAQAIYHSDLNQLFWSNEEANVMVSLVCGKCTVVYAVNIEENLDSFFLNGIDRFYFHDAYNADSRSFEDPPSNAKLMGSRTKKGGKSKGQGKGKGKGKGLASREPMVNEEDVEEKSGPVRKLKTLDVFAGCGGLSEGFHQAGVATSCWAIEKEKPAAQAFRLNNPGCTVFTEDCNLLLQWVMQGEEKDNFGQRLPQKGDVELLCGGPPCQGFSGMNRFNSREYSKFKNSLIASYLSYCDYYRPRFFLLENVRNFVSFKSNTVLKLALRCLTRMGYQCTFGVLQAGCYGVAQTRRRAILLAAAPGEKLPVYPEPMHTFAPRAMQLTVMVDDKKYTSNIQNTVSTPYRTITVRDAMSDLPEIMNGASKEEIDYKSDPETHFQRLIRGKTESQRPFLRDHICKEMSALVAARMRHIPLVPGSDWRDLPNMEVTLPDSTKTKKLLYSFPDKANGRSPKGSNRGVCSCASGRVCDPLARQFNTLIPWCLPHTGNRHNNWSGLYGRLEWDGFFSTTITNPEPMGKQGRVLHPEQHRVVSVRECARSQGFPDTYKFFGTVLDKHRQVGNAVPPPMGRAIGLEIKKCLVWKDKQEQAMKKEEGHLENGYTNGHCEEEEKVRTQGKTTKGDVEMEVEKTEEACSGGSSHSSK